MPRAGGRAPALTAAGGGEAPMMVRGIGGQPRKLVVSSAAALAPAVGGAGMSELQAKLAAMELSVHTRVAGSRGGSRPSTYEPPPLRKPRPPSVTAPPKRRGSAHGALQWQGTRSYVEDRGRFAA